MKNMNIVFCCFAAFCIHRTLGSPLSTTMNKLIQCPYAESACYDDIYCDQTAMGQRAGYFCDSWPFYSGGFAECCDENLQQFECMHAVYSTETNTVFCDFWYVTTQKSDTELKLCDCKLNNGKYCVSWVCVTVANYNFVNATASDALLSKLLLPIGVEIFGVHQCTYFDDAVLIENGVEIPQWCYKYDDYESCFCVPGNIGNSHASNSTSNDGYCANWVCHEYHNDAKNDLSIDEDFANPLTQQYWNATTDSDLLHNLTHSINSSQVELQHLSTKVSSSNAQYRCVQSSDYVDADGSGSGSGSEGNGNRIEQTKCVSWKGNVDAPGDRFDVKLCTAQNWNGVDVRTIDNIPSSTEMADLNMSSSDFTNSYVFQWQCHESGMPYRQNQQFVHFYLSTLIWSIAVGFIVLGVVFCYMQSKYITLSSFFCVQGWFFFIFGSVAAVHGGVSSFTIYFALQLIFFIHIACAKCKNRGKHPYGAVQRFEFEPMEQSMTRDVDDDKL